MFVEQKSNGAPTDHWGLNFEKGKLRYWLKHGSEKQWRYRTGIGDKSGQSIYLTLSKYGKSGSLVYKKVLMHVA
jgi:hypothetical protein